MLNEIDLSRADLNLLVLFQTVYEERHVGRAGERLSLSASAVSHGLGRLRRLLNDPLFLKTPKGVVPTERANQLAEPVADILARVRRVVSTAEPFDPARSARRFIIGSADAAVFLPPLLAGMGDLAPRIEIGVRQQLRGDAIADLDSRKVDIAIVPLDDIPARFVARTLFEEELVIVARIGHPFLAAPTLDRYCEMLHLVISLTGDFHTLLDEALAKLGRTRRVAVALPNFLLALAVIAESDLIAALPRSLLAMHAARFGVASTEVPLSYRRFAIRAIVPKVALMDPGIVWLLDRLAEAAERHLPRAREHIARQGGPNRKQRRLDRISA